MMEKICKICGEKIKVNNTEKYLLAQFTKHIKKIHNLTKEEYLIKYEKVIPPKCLCGCDNFVHLRKNSWEWNKYYADSHVGKVFSEEAKKIKENKKLSNTYVFDAKRYYSTKYDILSAQESATDFLSKNYSLIDLSNKYKLDKRTLKKMWFELNLVTPEQYIDITNYFRFNYSAQTRSEEHNKNLINDNIYTWIYLLLKENSNKYNIYSAVKEYNNTHVDKIFLHPYTIYRNIKKQYGDAVDIYIAKGYHSKEEYIFYQILCFYFPNEKIDFGFKIIDRIEKTNHNKDKYYYYDFCINNKLIIEYNSTLKYHNSEYEKENDIKKQLLANKSGYKFYTLTLNDIKKIDTLILIKEWLNS